MQTVQTTTAAMSTAAELLTAYNAITAYNTQEGRDLARAIIQGDTSGKLPAKREQITMEDCEGEYFIPAILATKPGKLSPQQAVAPLASRDTLRPAMNCVYYDTTRAAVVATCGHVLMSFPCGPLAPISGLLHPVTLEPLKVGDVVNKNTVGTGDVDNRYPDYVNVIRLPNPNGPAVTLDVQSFRNQLAGIGRAQRFVNLYTGIRARIQHEGQDFYVDAALCDNVLRAMQASGTTRVNLDLSEPNRALQFTDVNDAKKLALIMPTQMSIAYCTVLDTAVGEVLTSPASVKRTTVKKPVQPRAVQVLSKEEKKSLAAHVKQYEAADTTEQTRMLAHATRTLAVHLEHLRESTFRQLGQEDSANCIVVNALFLARVGRALLATIAPATSPATPAPAPAVAEPTINAMESALTETGFFVGGLTDEAIAHYYGKLITSPPMLEADAPAADDIALLTEHQADEYLRTANDEQPDELIRARHGETTDVLTPPRMSKRKNLFNRLTMQGDRVQVLHQVGKCAVVRVFPCEGRAPYYAARFRQHYAEFGHLREAGQALLTLRRLDNAEIRRDNEVFTATDALDQLGLDPACFARFCALHELDAGRSYMRRELRRAITDRRQPKMPVYLSLLNKLTITNPA